MQLKNTKLIYRIQQYLEIFDYKVRKQIEDVRKKQELIWESSEMEYPHDSTDKPFYIGGYNDIIYNIGSIGFFHV